MNELQKIKASAVFKAQLITDAATAAASIDTLNLGKSAMIIVNLSDEQAATSAAPTLSLLESDDTVVTNHVTITANLTPDIETGHLVIYHIDLRGRKRYLRATLTAGASGADVTASGVFLAFPDSSPESTTDMVESGGEVVLV